jgi:hypothetical protein
MLTITTNNRPRVLLSYDDLDASEQEQFDYIVSSTKGGYDVREELRFVRAYGQVWDTHEFESIQRGISVPVAAPGPGEKDKLVRWDGIQGQSHFHAIVLRYFDKDGYELEGPVVGWAQW